MKTYKEITELDIFKYWSPNIAFYFAQVLNGECTLEETREDLLSFINSEKGGKPNE